jgi:hypothetical protein
MNLEFNIKNVPVIYVSSVWQKRALYRIIAFAKERFRLPGEATHYFSQIEYRALKINQRDFRPSLAMCKMTPPCGCRAADRPLRGTVFR